VKIAFRTLFFLLFPAVVFAQPKTHELGASAIQLLKNLRKQGVHQVGDLNLQQLEKDIQTKVKWRWIKRLPPPNVAGERRSAYYLVKENQVLVSSKIPKGLTDEIPQLELHEALGALGINDRQYVFSTSLHEINQTKKAKDREVLTKAFGRSIFRDSNLYQGGSGVGGGGDLLSLQVKNRVLQEIEKQGIRPSMEFYLKFPLISFEPFNDNKDFVGLEYELRLPQMIKTEGALSGIPIENGMQEAVKIFIPMRYWEKSETYRKRIVQYSVDVVTGIFQLSPASKIKSRTPPGCPASKTVKYPVTGNGSIITIQDWRSAILLGCQNDYGIPTTGLKLRSPRWE
jgi:hypothetical protein